MELYTERERWRGFKHALIVGCSEREAGSGLVEASYMTGFRSIFGSVWWEGGERWPSLNKS